MDTSLSWIKAYVPDLECTAQEYTDAMTLSGTKVEGYREFDKNLDKIVVGNINKIEKHPDAVKLIVCQVQVDEAGTEVMTFSAVGDNQSVGGRSIEAYVLIPAAWRLKW